MDNTSLISTYGKYPRWCILAPTKAMPIPAHHGVGAWTYEITPIVSNCHCSSETFPLSDRGTCLGMNSAKGFVLPKSYKSNEE